DDVLARFTAESEIDLTKPCCLGGGPPLGHVDQFESVERRRRRRQLEDRRREWPFLREQPVPHLHLPVGCGQALPRRDVAPHHRVSPSGIDGREVFSQVRRRGFVGESSGRESGGNQNDGLAAVHWRKPLDKRDRKSTRLNSSHVKI